MRCAPPLPSRRATIIKASRGAGDGGVSRPSCHLDYVNISMYISIFLSPPAPLDTLQLRFNTYPNYYYTSNTLPLDQSDKSYRNLYVYPNLL